MWLSPDHGPYVLTGLHARLYRRGLHALVQAIEAGFDEHPSHLAPFDRLDRGQQLVLLEHVSTAVLDPTVPAEEPAAITDLAIAAVYARIGIEAVAELRGGTLDYWRTWIIEVRHEIGCNTVPGRHSDDESTWIVSADVLRDVLVRDSACDCYDEALDNPRLAARRREGWNLPQTYYTQIPPDPTEEQVAAARERLRQLTAGCAMLELRHRHRQRTRPDEAADPPPVRLGMTVEHDTAGHRLRGPILAMTARLCTFEIRTLERTDRRKRTGGAPYAIGDHLAVPWSDLRLAVSSEREMVSAIEYAHPTSTLTKLHVVRAPDQLHPLAVFWRRDDAEAWAKAQACRCAVATIDRRSIAEAAEQR